MKTKTIQRTISLSAASLAVVPIIGAITTDFDTVLAEQESCAVPAAWSVSERRALYTQTCDNLDEIVEGYNSVYNNGEDIWHVESVEYSAPVFLVEDDEYGMYFDFNEDNGYMVVTQNKIIYEIEQSGDLDYLRGATDIYYSYVDGFQFLNSDGNLQKFVEDSVEDCLLDGVYSNYNVDSTAYSGQGPTFDGKIDPSKLSNHVQQYYPGYTLTYSYNEVDRFFKYTKQSQTSYYIKNFLNENGDKNWISKPEANCALHAMYSVIRDWGFKKLISVPYNDTVDIRNSIQSDKLYDLYGKGNCWYDGSAQESYLRYYKWEVKTDSDLDAMPKLYIDVRNYAIDHSYDVNVGYGVNNVPANIKYVVNTLYQNNIDIGTTTNVETALENLRSYESVFVSILGSSSYGNHAVVLTGYYQYSKDTALSGGYAVRDYLYFYRIADGWNSKAQIFDPNTPANPTIKFCYLVGC